MLQVGDTLGQGRYEIEGVLGKGGMATVFQVRDTRLRVARAIKLLDPELSARAGLRKRFEVEAHSMARLSHANIVQVFDVVDDGAHFFIVMELVEGPSVLEQIDLGALDLKDAISLGIGVLHALEAAHDAGIIHRDIKPHNLLVGDDGVVRVTDFGIAQCADFADRSVTRTGAVMGTWAFMSPEQRADAKGVDPGADIYSTGATLYTMVTTYTPPDLFAAEIDPAMYEEVPRPVRDIIRRATRYWAWERYPSARAMREDLEVVLERLVSGKEQAGMNLRLQNAPLGEDAPVKPVPTSPPPAQPPPAPAPPPPAVSAPRVARRRPPSALPARVHPPPRRRSLLPGLLLLGLATSAVAGWFFLQPTRTIPAKKVHRPAQVKKAASAPVAEAPVKAASATPAILHLPPEGAVIDEQLELRVEIQGTSAYDKVTAYYRPRGEAEFRATRLNLAGKRYRGYLPVDRTMKSGVDYYIEAKSYVTGMAPLGWGSAEKPHTLKVAP